jgi:hypothetical protein
MLVPAQFSMPAQAAIVKNAVLDLNFELADSLLSSSHFDALDVQYLKAYKSFVFAVVSNRYTALDSAENVLTGHLQKIKNADNGAKSNYYQAELNLMLCLVSYQNQAFLKTFANYLSFQRLRKKNIAQNADFIYYRNHELVGRGLSHWLGQIVFNQEPDLKNFWKNDYAEYIAESQSKIQLNAIEYRELAIYDGLLQGNFRPFDGAENEDTASILIKGNEGPLEAYLAAMFYKSTGAYVKHLHVLAKADSLHFNKRFNMLNLRYGVALLNTLHSNSELYLTRFVSQNPKGQFANYAHLKLAWFYCVNGNSTACNEQIKSIDQNEKQLNSEDKQALYEIKHALIWTPELIQSRLLFDGGLYEESKQVLLHNKGKIATYNQAQKLMYSYQMARAYHKLDKLRNAIPFYEMAVNSNLQSQYYYPVYAAYNLGELYVKKHEFEKAKEYFTICLRFDSPVYKAEIHAKATKALQNMSAKKL